MELTTQSQEETMEFGKRLAQALKGGDILCLEGDLGAGKTTLVKGVAEGLGIDSNEVNSPTFVLMNVYEGKLPIYHFDLYRLDDADQIQSIEPEEYLYGEGVSLIEWSDKMGRLKPQECLQIHLDHKTEHERDLKITAQGERYKKMLSALT